MASKRATARNPLSRVRADSTDEEIRAIANEHGLEPTRKVSRDINDPRIQNVLGALAAWTNPDGETIESCCVENLINAAGLWAMRAPLIIELLTQAMLHCGDHILDRMSEVADEERRVWQDLQRVHAAEDALVALGVERKAAELIVSQAERKAQVSQ